MNKGIVRRIDELGRVVIPKELRRTLQIRDGEELEIIPSGDGEITIRKFSQLKELHSPIGACLRALRKTLGKDTIICDKTQFVADETTSKGYKNRPISTALLLCLENRKPLNTNKTLQLVKGDSATYSQQYISPIMTGGELYGGIIILGALSDKEKDLVALVNLCLQELVE